MRYSTDRTRIGRWSIALAATLGAACSGGTGGRSSEATTSAAPPAAAAENLPPAAPEASPPAAEVAGPLCLPVVSGCGCAYACGTSLGRNPDGTHTLTHDRLDSATVIAEVQSWCFDAAGHAIPAVAADRERTPTCREVFYDRSSCGGECIPTVAYLGCHAEGEACRP